MKMILWTGVGGRDFNSLDFSSIFVLGFYKELKV